MIEKSVEVDNWEVSGIKVWPLVRIHLNFSIDAMSKSTLTPGYRKTGKHISGFYKCIFILVYFFRSLEYLYKKVDILFITSSRRKHSQIEGKWFNNQVDPILPILKKKCIKYQILEYDTDYEFRLPGREKSKNITLNYLINTIKAKIYEPKIEINNTTRINLTKIKAILKDAGVDHQVINENLFKRKLSQLIVNSNYFRKVLNKTKPKLVVGSNAELALHLACSYQNILCADFQHGYQGEFHGGYANWSKIPENGFELLPDIYFVWGEEEKNVIDKWSNGTSHKAIIIGNPLSYFYSNYISHCGSEFREKYKNKINILISLQTDRGLLDLYKSLLDYESDKLFWWVRWHPCMLKEEKLSIQRSLEQLRNCNFSLDIASETPLYELLPIIDMHISENSNVVNDCLHFNIRSIVTHPSGAQFFKDEISRGNVFFYDQREIIIEKLFFLGKKDTTDLKARMDFEVRLLSFLNDLAVL